jgi:hypothetical protein
MWQAETFDPDTIDRELGWAADLGMTSMRVFLHDLCWTTDAPGFLARIDRFLAIAARHRIGALLVFFDSCHRPEPVAGRQKEPTPGWHNSIWAQSPGAAVLREPARFAPMEAYVTGVISHFRDDPRIHGWDLWNEPENSGPAPDLGADKGEAVRPLLERAFRWARAAQPSQPLTSGVWGGDWSDDAQLSPLQRLQLHASDVVSYHSYNPLPGMTASADALARFARPLLCTEYMARSVGSRFAEILPFLHERRIAAYNWGLVVGRSQTHLAWDVKMQEFVDGEPVEWFHDIFNRDGAPHRVDEVALLRRIAVRRATAR